MKRKKAPGMDGLANEILSLAWVAILSFVKELLDACLRESIFPGAWKTARVVALLKAVDKDTTLPGSYRPISLLCGWAKVLERMLVERSPIALPLRQGGSLSPEFSVPQTSGIERTDQFAALSLAVKRLRATKINYPGARRWQRTLNKKCSKTMSGMSNKEDKVTVIVGSDPQVPVVDGCKGGQYPASSDSYPGTISKTANAAESGSQMPPGDAPPRRSSIGGYSDVSSASLSKRKRTSSGAASAVDPCEIFLSIEADISMILEAFAARSRKEKCKKAMDAVPGRLENIRQDVFKFAMENALLKGRIAQLEGQLEAAQSRPRSFAEVAQRKVVHKERPKTVTTAQAAGQPPKPKPTRARKRSPKWERFVAMVRATSALGVRTGEELKAELFKAVDPVKANIGFDAIVKAKDSVIVEVRSKADLDRLLGSNGIKEKGLEVVERVASPTWPRLAIFDVPNSFSEDEVLGALASQNGDVLGNRSEAEIRALVKFKFKRGPKETGKTSCRVLEADPAVREALVKAKKVYLGTMRCRVDSYNGVTVCYKCQGFHHTTKACRSEALCRKCGGAHDSNVCDKEARKDFCARRIEAKSTHTTRERHVRNIKRRSGV
ncbi:unnamed protein product [Trichogramma brassicae]|uniref:Reverse transcriptase domain-containing protein n=1 Tax=Trichogramma brassicae TaxID=86971 RepID=A0A6H5J116_9HYME|nr:unnamed protein product [Trichogramma brassicae]